MVQQGKRILLGLITLVMVIGFVPFGVFANETVSDNTVEVTAQQLILGDDLTMRFYVAADNSYKENSAMHITVDGKTVIWQMSDTEPNGDGQYVFSVDLAAAQMTSEIELNFISHNTSILKKVYTIRDYAKVILEGNYPAETKQLVREMLSYGAKAQLYFKHNSQKLANDGYEIEASDAVPSEVPSITISGAVENIKYYGAALVFESKIAVRYYFKAPNGVEGYTFKVNGTSYGAQSKDGLFFVEISEMNPQDLDKRIAITVTAINSDEKMVVNYSPMHYICRMYHKDSTSLELKNLLHALYSYHMAAKTVASADNILDLSPEQTGDYNLGTVIPDL